MNCYDYSDVLVGCIAFTAIVTSLAVFGVLSSGKIIKRLFK